MAHCGQPVQVTNREAGIAPCLFALVRVVSPRHIFATRRVTPTAANAIIAVSTWALHDVLYLPSLLCSSCSRALQQNNARRCLSRSSMLSALRTKSATRSPGT
jgi:hypothetical protein